MASAITDAAKPTRAPEFNAAELAERVRQRRAVEAAIWGMPIVSVDAMRQAYFRDAGSEYNDIVFWSKPCDAKLQFTTPNASTYYVYFNFNLKEGPVVLDVPRAAGAGLFGSIVDAWQVPLADVGPEGDDAGQGGKYLLLPPDFEGSIPPSYIPVRSETLNGYGLLRAIPVTTSDADITKALSLVKGLRLYPLARAAPLPQRHIDMAGKLMDGVVAFDETFYERLARMVNEEPVMERDLVAIALLCSIGIEKGKAFEPTDPTKKLLRAAAREAHAGLMLRVRGGEGWWRGSQWKLPEDKGALTGFKFQTDANLFIDERALVYFIAFAVPKKLGAATFYLTGASDSNGEALLGERSYRLHVPAHVPARQYWAVTAYDLETACFIRNVPRPGVDSYDTEMQKNEDGSIDVYFGPKAPEGKQANWVPTAPTRPWFSLFRFYGPEKPLFDRAWTLPDITEVPPSG
jgi:hypothetical protein